MKKYLVMLLLAVWAMAGNSCKTSDPTNSNIPQSRPASWEHSGPAGFGGGGGFRGR